ncbi:MAG: 50S ribosomal protein L3 [Planctomycetota bacterium]
MALKLLGKKIGMTRVYTDDGVSQPVTAIEVGPCVVTQVKTSETDGYTAVQFGYDDIKARRSTMPMIAHDAKAKTAPKRVHREFRVDADEAESYELGRVLTVADLKSMAYVDVAGTSKGKGFQGVMKRHNFRGQLASHGTERKHRSPGSIGGHGTNLGTGPKIKKGKKMAGQMGNARVTVRSLDIVRIDEDSNLLLVKGPVPGPNGGTVEIIEPSRLYKSKARRQAEAAEG